MHSIKTRYPFIILGGSLLFVIAVTFINFKSRVEFVKANTIKSLKTVVQTKQTALERYLNGSIRLAESLASTEAVQKAADGLSANETEVNGKPFSEAAALIHLFQEEYWGVYRHIFLTDAHGKVRISPPHGGQKTGHQDEQILVGQHFDRALEQTQVTWFFDFKGDGYFHQLLLQPVKNLKGKTLGILAFEMDSSYILDILKQNFQLGKTARVFLTTLEGIPVNEGIGADYSFTVPRVEEILRGENLAGEFLNEQKQPVFAVYSRSTNYPWVVIAEIDKAEAYAAVFDKIRKTFLVLLSTVILMFLVLRVLSNLASKPISESLSTIKDIAQGDLTKRITVSGNDEFSELSKWVNVMADNLENVVRQISLLTEEIAVQSSILNQSSVKITDGAGRQSASYQQMTDHAQANAATATAANEIAQKVSSDIVCIGEDMEQSIELLESIEEGAKQVARALDLITDIAEQTNLLSLNAAIEAARASEQGKGFAVVAGEVRKLAKKSSTSTQDIERYISSSIQRVQKGLKLSQNAGQNLVLIVKDVQKVAEHLGSFSAETLQQAAMMLGSHSITEANARTSDELAMTAQTLQNQAVDLQRLIAHFKIGEGSNGEII